MEIQDIRNAVKKIIQQVAIEQAKPIEKIEMQLSIVDELGFTSLEVATLTALLEIEFGVDPFALDIANITEIRTVEDIADLYYRCLSRTGESTEKEKNVSSENSTEQLLERRNFRRGTRATNIRSTVNEE